MFVIYFLIFWFLMFAVYISLKLIEKARQKDERDRCQQWSDSFHKKYSIKSKYPIQTTISGIKYEYREKILISEIRKGTITEGTKLLLVPDPENKYDQTATKVCLSNGQMLGFLPNKEWNDKIFHDLSTGKKWDATVNELIKPSDEFANYNILLDLWEYFNEEEYEKYI